MISDLKRGDIVEVKLDPSIGREMMKTRRCVVVQNNHSNKYSDLTTIVPATDADKPKAHLPTWVVVPKGQGFEKDSIIVCDQIRTVDKERLGATYGRLSSDSMSKVDVALKIALALS